MFADKPSVVLSAGSMASGVHPLAHLLIAIFELAEDARGVRPL